MRQNLWQPRWPLGFQLFVGQQHSKTRCTVKKPRVIIIAGPNGAEKTTFVRELLPQEAGKRLLLDLYQPWVDQWVLYDNAGDEPVLMDWSDKP